MNTNSVKLASLLVAGPLLAVGIVSVCVTAVSDASTRSTFNDTLWRGLAWWYVVVFSGLAIVAVLTGVMWLCHRALAMWEKREVTEGPREREATLSLIGMILDQVSAGETCDTEIALLLGVADTKDVDMGLFHSGKSAEEIYRTLFDIETEEGDYVSKAEEP